jgi:hypothetical protein
MDSEVILAKTESLKDVFKEQFETTVSWTKVAAMKQKRYIHKEQMAADTFPVTSNRYKRIERRIQGPSCRFPTRGSLQS